MAGGKGIKLWGMGAVLAVLTHSVMAQSPDNLVVVVNSSMANGGASVGCFAYDPVADIMFVGGFGSSGHMRRVNNVSSSQSFDVMVSTTEWTLFQTDGHTDYSGGQIIPSGMVLNPKPIYDADGTTVVFPAYSQAWIVDMVTNIKDPYGTLRDDLMRRGYRYNLQQVQAAPDPMPAPPPYYDGRDVFTSLVTRRDLVQATGSTSTDNLGRQPAWSSDGQWLYCLGAASATTYGGIWKVNARTGAFQRIYSDALNNEPVVFHTSEYDLDPANPVEGDQIVMCGTTASGNAGAVDYVIDDGTTVHGPYRLFTAQNFLRFVEWNGYDLPRVQLTDGSDPGVNNGTVDTVYSISRDIEGNFYFYNATQNWVWRFDPEGRFASLKSRQLQVRWNKANGSTQTGGSTLRMTVRNVSYGSTSNQFDVPQILFQSVDLKGIGGLYAFKPGDFNRDNVVNGADLALFRAALGTPVGTYHRIIPSGQYAGKTAYYEAPADENGGELERSDPAAYVNYLKFDLNANNLVTGKDSLILWRFMGYAPVDYDMDGDVDQTDFGHFQQCWSGTRLQRDPLCADADLDNNEYVNQADLDLFSGCASGAGIPADVRCLD